MYFFFYQRGNEEINLFFWVIFVLHRELTFPTCREESRQEASRSCASSRGSVSQREGRRNSWRRWRKRQSSFWFTYVDGTDTSRPALIFVPAARFTAKQNKTKKTPSMDESIEISPWVKRKKREWQQRRQQIDALDRPSSFVDDDDVHCAPTPAHIKRASAAAVGLPSVSCIYNLGRVQGQETVPDRFLLHEGRPRAASLSISLPLLFFGYCCALI